jgi:hypothetical protein
MWYLMGYSKEYLMVYNGFLMGFFYGKYDDVPPM